MSQQESPKQKKYNEIKRRKFLKNSALGLGALAVGSWYAQDKLPKWVRNSKLYFDFYTKTMVLMYHRVENIKIDPWGLSVSPENFESQLQVLKETGLVKSTEELSERIYSGKKVEPTIIITFDDGYVDNFSNAKPLLEKYDLPATFFISSLNFGKQKEYWWDELINFTMTPQDLPTLIEFEWKSGSFKFSLKGEERLTDELLRKNELWDGNLPFPTLRAELYFKLWERISILKHDDQQIIMDDLRTVLGTESRYFPNNFSMSENQLVTLSANNLFTIGGHTTTHPILTTHSREFQREEIKQNKNYLESLTKKNIDTFSFPHGNFNDETIAELKDLGFKTSYTTVGKSVQEFGENPFLIGRVQVYNMPKEKFYSSLESWLV